LSTLVGFYIVLLIVRVILSFVSDRFYSKPVRLIFAATDPYFGFFRAIAPGLNVEGVDLSPLLAMACAAVVNGVLTAMARAGTLLLGFSLMAYMVIGAADSAVSFVLGALIVLLVLRLIAELGSRSVDTPFWKSVDAISGRVVGGVNKLIFGGRAPSYRASLVTAILAVIAVLAAAKLGLWLLGLIFYHPVGRYR
jgi:uncharacterized protein YggT (Ycf19 family)